MSTKAPKIFQAYQETPWRKQLQLIGVVFIVIVIVGSFQAVSLHISSQAGTVGREVQELQGEVLFQEQKVANLETQLAQLTSAEAMAERARALGFVPVEAGEVTFVEVNGYPGRDDVKFAPPPLPLQATANELPPEFTQTLFDLFREFAFSTIENGEVNP